MAEPRNLRNPPIYSRPGAEFRRLREKRGWTLHQVAELLEQRYGKDGGPSYQQISKLEKDKIDKPSLQDLARLGEVYNLSPTEVAQIYGVWTPPSAEQPAEQPKEWEVRLLKDTLRQLDREERQLALYLTEFVARSTIERHRWYEEAKRIESQK